MGRIKRGWEKERNAKVVAAFRLFCREHGAETVTVAIIQAFMASPHCDGQLRLDELESILVGHDD